MERNSVVDGTPLSEMALAEPICAGWKVAVYVPMAST